MFLLYGREGLCHQQVFFLYKMHIRVFENWFRIIKDEDLMTMILIYLYN
jgi:hypothetical protein